MTSCIRVVFLQWALHFTVRPIPYDSSRSLWFLALDRIHDSTRRCIDHRIGNSCSGTCWKVDPTMLRLSFCSTRNDVVASPLAYFVPFLRNGQSQDRFLSFVCLLWASSNASRKDLIHPWLMCMYPSHLHASCFTQPHLHGFLGVPFPLGRQLRLKQSYKNEILDPFFRSLSIGHRIPFKGSFEREPVGLLLL